MQVITMKKTFNLHGYGEKLSDLFSNRKIIIPAVFSVFGLFCGCFTAKGEGELYNKIITVFSKSFMINSKVNLLPEFMRYLLIPSILAGILFFFGLCVFGTVLSNSIPFCFSLIVGMISYYTYKTFLLKGLAYCMIIIFPYSVLVILGLIFCCRESISMAEVLQTSIIKSKKYIDYNFSMYYKNFFKKFVLIVIAAAVKGVIDYLFLGLFNF